MEEKTQRYIGCLLGLAVGDAMGYPVDKKDWSQIAEDYGPNGLLGYDLANGNADTTSYTQLAAFGCNGMLLAAIRGSREKYPAYLAMSQREWLKSQQFRGSGEKTHCWVAQVPELRRRHCMDTRMLDALGRDTLGTPEKPIFRSDNPCSMTVAIAPGMIFHPDRLTPEELCKLGGQAVAFTHGDPETYLAGSVLACAIASILHAPQAPLAKHFTRACELMEQYMPCPEAAKVTKLVNYAMELTKDPELTPLVSMSMLGCTTGAECLAGAVYASMIHPANFDEGMIAAVNHSGRSAATGALTGAILGAKLGADALPEFYLESLECAPALRELATDLAQGRQIVRIFDDTWDQKYVQGLPTEK